MTVLSTEGVDKVASVLAMQQLPDIAETILSYAYVVKSVANSDPYVLINGHEVCRFCYTRQPDEAVGWHDDKCIWVYSRKLGGMSCS